MIDVELVRKETKATRNLIHFNNAGASLPPDCVLASVIEYLNAEASIGGYEAEAKYNPQFQKIYSSIAQLINADEDEIALVESATRAWDRALSSISFKAGDIILTSYNEYISNYIALIQVQKHYGVKIEFISDDPASEFKLEDLKRKMSHQVKLIALTHVPSTNGLVNSLKGVSDIAQSYGAYFLLDACQSIGQIDVDVKNIGCDFLAATGRKFLRAPRGTGFLYVSKKALASLEPQYLDFSSAQLVDNQNYQMRADARRFENYETNYAARLGLGKAVDYALSQDMKLIEKRVRSLAKALRHQLTTVIGVTVWDVGTHQSGIVTFSVKDQDSRAVSQKLREKGINTSVSYPSFAIDLKERGISSIVRASLHYYNTEEEIIVFMQALKEII